MRHVAIASPSPRLLFPSHPAFSEGVRGKIVFSTQIQAVGKVLTKSLSPDTGTFPRYPVLLRLRCGAGSRRALCSIKRRLWKRELGEFEVTQPSSQVQDNRTSDITSRSRAISVQAQKSDPELLTFECALDALCIAPTILI